MAPDVSEAVRRLKVDGFVLVTDVIPAAQLDPNFTDELLEYTRTDPAGAYGLGMLDSIRSFAPYLADPRLMAIAEAMFGPHFRISHMSSVSNEPGVGRGFMHADWPYNGRDAARVQAPFPDTPFHLTTLWMLSPYTEENGGTFVVPGSHRSPDNPTWGNGVDPDAPYPTEIQAMGPGGAVLVFDSRLWHSVAPNRSAAPRVSLRVDVVPWWLNLNIMIAGSGDRAAMVDEIAEPTFAYAYEQAMISPATYAALPAQVKPLLRHWVRSSDGPASSASFARTVGADRSRPDQRDHPGVVTS